ncbi:unannotated protein [freshwater metagenome]|uniref:Unannotated protein n=1 Tax=freshwater metagenome TaxID=449393 RepID=A0A6J5ZME0_9ZZZZ|nr:hypothetical protein [Actinomycetota bacterium]MSX11580.1 hypothetical protein [Actinomycetota bacterium]
MASKGHTHEDHDHVHGPGCGHTAIVHDGHIDFIHDGHLHQPHGDHVDEHSLPVDEQLPDACNRAHDCGEHVHGPDCGHEAVPHGEHTDYLVDGRLHHPHEDHCDDHGGLDLA